MNKLFTDGGSRGNPGNAATGYFLFDKNDHLVSYGGEFLGIATNNSAEYLALISGLTATLKDNEKEVQCFLDSELVVKQLNGEYKVKHAEMKILFDKVITLRKQFKTITFNHIPREKNKFADRMVNIILDNKD